jgi:hypothetical protein
VRRGAETSRRFFSFEPGLVSSPSKRPMTLLAKARLGERTSPESGFAVSVRAK